MQKADCYHLGYIAKLHGFKGEVSFFLDVTDPFEYEGLKQVYVDINGFLTPFFIKSINLRPKGFATVKLEGVETENDAQSLVRKNLYLPLADLPQLSDKMTMKLLDLNWLMLRMVWLVSFNKSLTYQLIP
jgi:16S rRNA processing protein RimM